MTNEAFYGVLGCQEETVPLSVEQLPNDHCMGFGASHDMAVSNGICLDTTSLHLHVCKAKGEALLEA